MTLSILIVTLYMAIGFYIASFLDVKFDKKLIFKFLLAVGVVYGLSRYGHYIELAIGLFLGINIAVGSRFVSEGDEIKSDNSSKAKFNYDTKNIPSYADRVETIKGMFRAMRESSSEEKQEREEKPENDTDPVAKAWKILDLEPGSSKNVIIKRHKRLIRIYHPDSNIDASDINQKTNAEKSALINSAKDILLKHIE